VRLWVNSQQIVNNWTNHAPTENRGTIALTAGQQYTIKLEYYENTGGAALKLEWSSPSQARQVIPQSQLYPSAQTTPTTPPAPTATPAPTTQPTATPLPTATPGTGRYFSTLPVGAALPSDAECAAAVKRRPENKRVNATYNATRGNQTLPSNFLSGDPRVNTLTARVNGNFTGTTDEILQWAACKWGVDEDMVRAQAAIESWWRQTTKGDWTTNANNCAPGHGLGVDGRPGECPESFGILQNRYPYEKGAWPGIDTSTAFNADTAYAIWRACYEGYEWWLNDVERGQQYAAGDAWGCMGRWFAGRWHTQPAEDYIGRVKGYLSQRIWEQASFQEP
jgi:autotransporter family porin